jgi:hypothetical protein
MVALRCTCRQGEDVWGEVWWAGGGHRWVFFDDDRTSETYTERIGSCAGCGKPFERKEMQHSSALEVVRVDVDHKA